MQYPTKTRKTLCPFLNAPRSVAAAYIYIYIYTYICRILDMTITRWSASVAKTRYTYHYQCRRGSRLAVISKCYIIIILSFSFCLTGDGKRSIVLIHRYRADSRPQWFTTRRHCSNGVLIHNIIMCALDNRCNDGNNENNDKRQRRGY